MRTAAAAAMVALACMLLAPALVQAAPATLKGKLTGVKVPAAGAGVASVRAMNVNTSAVVAARYVKRGGAFRLRAPAGAYGLLAAVVPFGGPRVIEKVVGRVRLKGGRTRSVKLRLKKPKRRAHTSAVRDGFGDVAVNYPAIAVHPFKSANSADAYLGKGIADMLITDLLGAIAARAPCKAIIVERTRIDAVLDELRLSRGPLVDPGTRPKAGMIIKDNAKVTGTISTANGVMTVTATYTNFKTGKATSFTESGPESDFFEIERRLNRKLAEHICGAGPPPAFAGDISGTASYGPAELGTGNSLSANWSGNVRLVKSTAGAPPPGSPGPTAAFYQVATGSLLYQYTGRVGDCNVAGSKTVDLAAQPDLMGAAVLNVFDGEPRTYGYVVPVPMFETVPGTKSSCDDPEDEGDAFGWAMAAGVPALVNAPLPGGPVASDWGMSGSGSGDTGGGSPDQTWAWTLVPSS